MTLQSLELTFYQQDQKKLPSVFGQGYLLRFQFPFSDYHTSCSPFKPIGSLSGTIFIRPGLVLAGGATCSLAEHIVTLESVLSKASGLSGKVLLEDIGKNAVLWKGPNKKVLSTLQKRFLLSDSQSAAISDAVPVLASVTNSYHGLLYSLDQRQFHMPKDIGITIAKCAPLLFHSSFYSFFEQRIVLDSAIQLLSPQGLLRGVALAQGYSPIHKDIFVPKPEIAEHALLDY